MSNFDTGTIRMLVAMFDEDGDGLINVNEFAGLFNYITGT